MCYFTSSQIKIQKKVPTARLGSCPDPGLNRGHLDLQSNALPTELPRPTGSHSENRSTVPVPSPHEARWELWRQHGIDQCRILDADQSVKAQIRK